jgi:cation diffusion facilitator family transporter
MPALKNNAARDIRLAAVTASVGNAMLAALKISAGLLSGSGALVADGIDSSGDVFIGIMTLVVAGIIAKPADARHPWGHRRAETIATVALSFTLFFMGAQLIVNALSRLAEGGLQTAPSFIAVVVTLVSITGKVLLALSQHWLGKRAGSAMIQANAKNMVSDVLVSLGVLAGLLISRLTGSGYADAVIAALIGLWIIKTAVGIFLETNQELMDGNNNIKPYRVIVDAVNSVEGADNPHRARIRSIAGFWDITFDVDVDPHLTVIEAHDIASRVEKEIKRRLTHVFDVMIHVEPRGDTAAETFGLSEEAMSGERID